MRHQERKHLNQAVLDLEHKVHRLQEFAEWAGPLLRILVRYPIAVEINQLGETMITGVPQGGTKHFQESFVPANAQLPAGVTGTVTWTVDDPKVTLAPSADGSSVAASVDASDSQGTAPAGSAPSFNLTATMNLSAALASGVSSLSKTVNVPILPTPPPQPSGLDINQLD